MMLHFFLPLIVRIGRILLGLLLQFLTTEDTEYMEVLGFAKPLLQQLVAVHWAVGSYTARTG